MILSYRNFRFTSGEVGSQMFKEAVRNEAQDTWAIRHRWTLDGMILNPGGNVSTMTTLIQQAEAAFDQDYGDLILYQANGSSRSAHSLINAQTLSGVRVVSPLHFPKSEGPEGVCFRSFAAVLEAEIPLQNPDSLLQSWTEQVTYSGGGPSTEYLLTLYGRPIKYTGRQMTTFTAVQSGSSVGLYFYPTPAFPLWPDAEKRPLRTYTKGTPKPTGLRKLMWPISWQYTFESADPLVGGPTGWPGR